MVTRGFQPALIGTPYRSKDHKKIHLALVLIGQNEPMDWTQDSRELIQTLRCQEGNAYAAIIENESLHIGQPFGKTELQRHPNLNDSLRGSAFHTNRQLSALKRRGKTIEEWNAQTFILYYEPLKPEPHPGTGLHVTTAVIQTFSSSFQVRDAKQPKISWHFEEPGLAGNDPLLPEGRVKTHSGYSLEKMKNKVGDRPNT
ncbi:hypothetical protein RAB80_018249 [Fusarium oxysporum f. sp. vasinfectum]|nr:hypothetical protein RAB80_018249 [Fusarium oxysporum f. sp. vasinfectum]KAK2922438.1 hypothetical protein FoTM2_017794 [Fusarium oxysporum f. sp. vasinfectum]